MILYPGFVSIADWIDRRNYAKHKEHLRRWLHEWQIDNIKGFLDITHALGLNDTLWVKQASSSLTWPEVSLYSNDFNDVAAVTAFSKGLQGLRLSSTLPDVYLRRVVCKMLVQGWFECLTLQEDFEQIKT